MERVGRASSPGELRSCLGELEVALLPGFLAKEFVRVPRIIKEIFVSEESADAPSRQDDVGAGVR